MRHFVGRRSEVAGGQPLQHEDADGQRWVLLRPAVAGRGSLRPRDGQPPRRRRGPLPIEPALRALASHGRRCVSESRIDAFAVGVGVTVAALEPVMGNMGVLQVLTAVRFCARGSLVLDLEVDGSPSA